MIAQAYDSIGRCSCYDTIAGDILPCPQHGFRHLPAPKIRSTNHTADAALAPPPTPEVHSTEYARGRAHGFREGVEAAMKLMGVK